MIALNYRDGKPIYEQIQTGFRHLILSGAMVTHEKLPSVRELAGQLAINANTIQRAYRELESDGFVYSVPGKGSFVAPVDQLQSVTLETHTKALQQAAMELSALGQTREQILQLLDAVL